MTVKVRAPAKVNLFLEVTRRRPDGYHDLLTLFARVGAADRLVLRRRKAPGIGLKVSGAKLDVRPEENLVYKAAAKFFSAFGIRPAVEISLAKDLPAGAGLGGGSSDCAAALLGLCRLYRVPVAANRRRLMELGAELGSDVPFFLLGSPAAAGAGRGERLRPLPLRGRLPAVIIVFPGKPVFTREVFGRLRLPPPDEARRRAAAYRRLCASMEKGKADLAPALFNRLEEAVLPHRRDVRLAKERLLRAGAGAALMSGSGACVFGLEPDRAKARRIAAALKRNKGYRVFLTEFC